MEKDPPTVDPLQPLHLSYNIDHVTYASSLLALDELKVLESMLQQNRRRLHLDSLQRAIHPFVASHRLNVIPSHDLSAKRFGASTRPAEDHPGRG